MTSAIQRSSRLLLLFRKRSLGMQQWPCYKGVQHLAVGAERFSTAVGSVELGPAALVQARHPPRIRRAVRRGPEPHQ